MQKVNYMINVFLATCADLRVPVSMDKTEWGQELIILISILLDGKNLMLAVLVEKKQFALQLLRELHSSKKSSVKKLQHLCGYLNFLCKAIIPGRAFVRHMYSKYSNIVNLDGAPRNAVEFKLKQHHHMRLDVEFKMDCQVWIDFLSNHMEVAVSRPMVDWRCTPESATNIQFFLDAGASEKAGGLEQF